MKIAIIGYSGSGKSTLAKELGKKYGVDVLHLDNISFHDDWQTYSLDERKRALNDFMDNHSGWIIDGNYYSLGERRFVEADQVIFLDYNRVFCYLSALRRYLKNKGQTRECCPCVEKFDLDFQKWILFEGRSQDMRHHHLKIVNEAKKGIRITSRRQLNQLKKGGVI